MSTVDAEKRRWQEKEVSCQRRFRCWTRQLSSECHVGLPQRAVLRVRIKLATVVTARMRMIIPKEMLIGISGMA